MADILHRVGVVAPLDDVYRAVATPEGIAGWRTTDTAGKSEVGGSWLSGSATSAASTWRSWSSIPPAASGGGSPTGPEEWTGTEIDWRLDQRGEYTIVQFKHEGWREPAEFMHHCSTNWARFLMSLKELVETGRGRPAPDDVQISDWH